MGCTLTTVDKLIDLATKCWKIGVLENLFYAEDVNLIRAIPLSVRDPPDYLIWHHRGMKDLRSGRPTMRQEIGYNPQTRGHLLRTLVVELFGQKYGMQKCHRKLNLRMTTC